jgi:NADP-dependent 3-hydroxy acid dehydrogenase YdfG
VKALRAASWEVVAVARRADRLDAVAAETGCDTFVADVTQQADVEALVSYTETLGAVDALINVAGGAIGVDFVAEADSDDWSTMMELNVVSVQRMVKAFLPALRKASSTRGVADIVTISSTAAFISYEGGGGYNAAKAGVHAALGALRLELAGEPIRVVEVAPGMVKTEEFALNRLGGDAEKAEALYEGVEAPLTAEDVADVVAYALHSPPHVNLDVIQMKPVAQAAQYKLHRGPLAPKL